MQRDTVRLNSLTQEPNLMALSGMELWPLKNHIQIYFMYYKAH